MKFKRDSEPEDRCWFCRRFCGEPVLGDSTGKHGRFAFWICHLGRHVEISAHDSCYYLDERVPQETRE